MPDEILTQEKGHHRFRVSWPCFGIPSDTKSSFGGHPARTRKLHFGLINTSAFVLILKQPKSIMCTELFVCRPMYLAGGLLEGLGYLPAGDTLKNSTFH